MDFSPDEAQQAVAHAAAEVLAGAGPPVPGEPFDWTVWQKLGKARLLALAVPDWLGGGGLGVLETAALLTEVGRHAAPVPAPARLMTGVLPVVRWGDRAAQEGLLPGAAAGDVVLTAAIREPSEPGPESPRTTVTGSSTSSSSVSGLKVGVTVAAAGRWLLVPATEPARSLEVKVKRNTVLTFGGGVNEIQRELIATAGLGLPRVPR